MKKKEKKIITKKIIMIIMKIDAFWGIFFHKLFLQKKLKGDRNDESCAINEFFLFAFEIKKCK